MVVLKVVNEVDGVYSGIIGTAEIDSVPQSVVVG